MKKLIITLSVIGAILLGLTAGAYAMAILSIANYNQIDTPVKPTKVIPLPLATDVEAGINEYRISQGLAPFNSEVTALDQAAQVRAEGMCAANDWSHTKDWEVLEPYYNYSTAGENLYYGFLQKDQAVVAMKAWIASPSHHTALVTNYSEIGVGVKYCPGFQNEPTAVIITNYFGVPR